jgi:cytochrome c-type biogenesis protein CcmH
MSSAAATTLNLDVSISPALQAEARGKVLFVLARAPGERMPLAVVKLDAGTWPVKVVLDAQSTLDPRRPLASVPKVEVEARVSAGGTPMPAPGDLLGATVLPTGRTVSAALTIDHRRQ